MEEERREKIGWGKLIKIKLVEKYKQSRFQDSIKILDNLLSSQRSPSIKLGLGFCEIVKENPSHKHVHVVSKTRKKIPKGNWTKNQEKWNFKENNSLPKMSMVEM